MNKLLIDKYRKDELTPEELSELRKSTDVMPDEEIAQQLHAAWMNDNIDISAVDDTQIRHIKNDIDEAIGRKKFGMPLLIRWAQMAAAILLPIFIVLTVHLYNENSLAITEEMVVSTGIAERARITLPDGTIVALNAESRLGYVAKEYNKKERKISFGGEGYFQVYSDKDVPFLINAKGLQVKVLGTVFNFSVRDQDATAELALEEGSVSLLSTRSNTSVTLQKNQKAILDHSTGNITVVSDENIKDKSAWRRGDMVFRNTELSQVCSTIEENYNVTIHIDCEECLTDQFTGTLPINDLNEVLEVIERSYHLKAIRNGKEIHLKNN